MAYNQVGPADVLEAAERLKVASSELESKRGALPPARYAELRDHVQSAMKNVGSLMRAINDGEGVPWAFLSCPRAVVSEVLSATATRSTSRPRRGYSAAERAARLNQMRPASAQDRAARLAKMRADMGR